VGGVVGSTYGGVPPRQNLKEQKKLVREEMGRTPYEKSTDVIRSKQRDTKQTKASCYLLTFNKLGIEDLMEFSV
jgi:hypothetical protein